MNIYPQHLRESRHIKIIRRRALRAVYPSIAIPVTNEAPASPRLGFMGRIWKWRSGLTHQQAAAVLPSAACLTLPWMWVPLFGMMFLAIPFSFITEDILSNLTSMSQFSDWALVFLADAACLGSAAAFLPRRAFINLHKRPVSTMEIDSLLAATQDDVERAYLFLVRDAIVQNIPSEAAADIQATIRAIGVAVEQLPLIATEPFDVSAVRLQAETILDKSQHEPDAMITDSLRRRADALNRRADANERSALLVRRAYALREELMSQIEAIREELTGFNVGVTDQASLARLAEDAQRIAAEATAVSQARAELDAPTARLSANAPIEQAIQQLHGS